MLDAEALVVIGAAPVARTECAHCGSALAMNASDPYCCAGCRAVAALLNAGGLGRYYELRNGRGVPVPSVDVARRDLAWLAPLRERLDATDGVCRLALDVSGMHCAGCVWVLETIFRRREGAVRLVCNPALGQLEMWVSRDFALEELVREVEPFGYLLGPALKTSAKSEETLLLRTGVAIALAANAMMFALAIYLGLNDGPLFTLLRTLEVALAAGAVAVALPVFGRSALEGIRRGVLHLDLPIALGMILAFGGTVWAYFDRPHASYGDTVAIFAALMLLGRWLTQRVVSRNRDRLLRSEGADGLFARRIEEGRVHVVRCSKLCAGDSLLVAPGEIVAVDATLESGPASVSMDWISGESAPRTLRTGETVPAGAFCAGASAMRLRAQTAFADSPLVTLLGRPMPETDPKTSSVWWDAVARVYVASVLLLAALALIGWWLWSGDLARALEITTALLVVTCPCGIGIATPLGYELVGSRLKRLGSYIRRERLLERVPAVRRVVFDKTGTLTTGAPELIDPAALDRLDPQARAALADLVARSAHPKSSAIRQGLVARGADSLREEIEVLEVPGEGLEACIDGSIWRLGRAPWAVDCAESADDAVFSRDGLEVCRFATCEALRPDAREEISALEREGCEVWILSGDTNDRVRSIAAQIGVPEVRAIGGCTPAEKAEWIAAHDHGDTLFVGDGINDGPAAEIAFIAGTPAIDRPFLPSRADFYFVTPGLGPIRALLHAGRRLRAVIRRNLAFAVVYNAFAVALCIAGVMQPWIAAIAMPASSVLVLSITAFSLRDGALTSIVQDAAKPVRT